MSSFDLDDAQRLLAGLTAVKIFFEGTKDSPGVLDQINELLDAVKMEGDKTLNHDEIKNLLISLRFYNEEQIEIALERMVCAVETKISIQRNIVDRNRFFVLVLLCVSIVALQILTFFI